MKQRVISGAVLVVILAITLYFGGIVTCGLMALVSLVGNMELLRVYGVNKKTPGIVCIFIGYACCVCADIPNIQR